MKKNRTNQVTDETINPLNLASEISSGFIEKLREESIDRTNSFRSKKTSCSSNFLENIVQSGQRDFSDEEGNYSIHINL